MRTYIEHLNNTITMTAAASSYSSTVAKFAALTIVPYLVGIYLSPTLVSPDLFRGILGDGRRNAYDASVATATGGGASNAKPRQDAATSAEIAEGLDAALKKNTGGTNGGGDPFDGVTIVLHRNGEAEPCGSSSSSSVGLYDALLGAATSLSRDDAYRGDSPSGQYDKYATDALLTLAFGDGLDSTGDDGSSSTCGPTTWTPTGDLAKLGDVPDLLKFCDMGQERTPVQLDHKKMVRLRVDGGDGGKMVTRTLPCHFHTREGVRITSLEQLADLARAAGNDRAESCAEASDTDGDGSCAIDDGGDGKGRQKSGELHLYAVQAGRVFIFAPSYVGEIFELPHVKVASGLPVWLEVLSVSPRVFDVYNFFDREESAAIVRKALAETSETHRIKRSSTGASGYNVNTQRTSENGFDTHGQQAMAVKRRCMSVLGFEEYTESLTDGLQVLRYNKTTAYIPHMDWIDDPRRKEEHNFDSAGVGSNRFATILLYMTDLGEKDGGETVFTHGWPAGQPEEEHVQFDEALSTLRESGDADMLKAGSWEETMAAKCRSRLAIRPHSSRAVLFYSQHPDGRPDNASLHGGCPVLDGEKWAANLWVWNAPRGGYAGAPVNKDVVERNRKNKTQQPSGPKQLSAVFQNSGKDPRYEKAELYFQDTLWGALGSGDPPQSVNTYEGHVWHVKVNGEILTTWTIDNRPKQTFTV